eukprot:gene12960-biopygen920
MCSSRARAAVSKRLQLLLFPPLLRKALRSRACNQTSRRRPWPQAMPVTLVTKTNRAPVVGPVVGNARAAASKRLQLLLYPPLLSPQVGYLVGYLML